MRPSGRCCFACSRRRRPNWPRAPEGRAATTSATFDRVGSLPANALMVAHDGPSLIKIKSHLGYFVFLIFVGCQSRDSAASCSRGSLFACRRETMRLAPSAVALAVIALAAAQLLFPAISLHAQQTAAAPATWDAKEGQACLN